MAVKELPSMYVDGRWERLPQRNSDLLEVVNPATAETIANVVRVGDREVELAVGAARHASAEWSHLHPEARTAFLVKVAQHLQSRSEEIARAITTDVGTPIKDSRHFQVGLAVRAFFKTAELLRNMPMRQHLGDSLIARLPLGVTACITPWNYPVYQMATKVAPALAAGCTVVAKPSELAPLGPLELAEAVHAAGLPAGVFNLVIGTGQSVGEAMVRSRDVDAVSFTGSTAAGRRVATLAGATVKHLSLELGGKSASVILHDADFERAVEGTVAKCFQNAGQTCAALTRLLVPRDTLTLVEELAVDCARGYGPGDPQDEATRLGPVASESQRKQVLDCIASGVRQGAKLLTGGHGVNPPDFEGGYFLAPTVFSDVTPNMTIARDEIFGPVLVIIPWDSESEAVEIANGTDYGLSGAVWSRDKERALRVASELRCGSVSINGASTNPEAPFGGFKQSGYGRERGQYGIEEFLTTRAVHGVGITTGASTRSSRKA